MWQNLSKKKAPLKGALLNSDTYRLGIHVINGVGQSTVLINGPGINRSIIVQIGCSRAGKGV